MLIRTLIVDMSPELVSICMSDTANTMADSTRDLLTIPDYFEGKNVLITGGTGFLGLVLIEKLLRSCPKVGDLFDKLKTENPAALKKLKLIPGDVGIAKLGLSQEDETLITSKVNIIYHVAASIRFDDHLRDAIRLNLYGTVQVVKLALKCQRLEVFVHTSTAYCCSDIKPEIREEVYPAALDWREALQILDCPDPHTAEVLTLKYIKPHQNTYIFTKRLAEQAIVDLCKDKINSVIIRPSIACWYYYYMWTLIHAMIAAVLDLTLQLTGKPPRLMRISRTIFNAQMMLYYFTWNKFDFKNDNYVNLDSKLTSCEDKLHFQIRRHLPLLTGEIIGAGLNSVEGIKRYALKEQFPPPESLVRKHKININIIYHVAASVRFNDHLQDAIKNNLRSTVELLKLALHCENMEVRETIETLTCKIIHPLKNTYTYTKRLAEQAVEDMCKDKIRAVILRPSIVYNGTSDIMWSVRYFQDTYEICREYVRFENALWYYNVWMTHSYPLFYTLTMLHLFVAAILDGILKKVPTIPEYFNGKDIFLTGGTGFVGKVLIEKLLRSCPGVRNIYVLLFDIIRRENPSNLYKVNIIYHVAASVRFDDPLRDAIITNIRSTREIIQLALKCTKLEAFMHRVAEHVTTELCKDKIPAIIFRPSISKSRHLRLKLIKTRITSAFYAKKDSYLDFVSVDNVVKGMLIATWEKGLSKEKSEVSIYNACSELLWKMTLFQDYQGQCTDMMVFEKTIWRFRIRIVQCWYRYYLNTLFHVAVDAAIDQILKLQGRKPRLFQLIRKIFIAQQALEFFMMNNFVFNTERFDQLDSKLLEGDERAFRQVARPKIGHERLRFALCALKGVRRFVFKEREKSPEETAARSRR
nr:unnamed protein product [Callosobruchus analis]